MTTIEKLKNWWNSLFEYEPEPYDEPAPLIHIVDEDQEELEPSEPVKEPVSELAVHRPESVNIDPTKTMLDESKPLPFPEKEVKKILKNIKKSKKVKTSKSSKKSAKRRK